MHSQERSGGVRGRERKGRKEGGKQEKGEEGRKIEWEKWVTSAGFSLSFYLGLVFLEFSSIQLYRKPVISFLKASRLEQEKVSRGVSWASRKNLPTKLRGPNKGGRGERSSCRDLSPAVFFNNIQEYDWPSQWVAHIHQARDPSKFKEAASTREEVH